MYLACLSGTCTVGCLSLALNWRRLWRLKIEWSWHNLNPPWQHLPGYNENMSLETAGVHAKNLTRDFPNAKYECTPQVSCTRIQYSDDSVSQQSDWLRNGCKVLIALVQSTEWLVAERAPKSWFPWFSQQSDWLRNGLQGLDCPGSVNRVTGCGTGCKVLIALVQSTEWLVAERAAGSWLPWFSQQSDWLRNGLQGLDCPHGVRVCPERLLGLERSAR
jgi:hypothetical protein